MTFHRASLAVLALGVSAAVVGIVFAVHLLKGGAAAASTRLERAVPAAVVASVTRRKGQQWIVISRLDRSKRTSVPIPPLRGRRVEVINESIHWSPDGRALAFVGTVDRTRDGAIFILDRRTLRMRSLPLPKRARWPIVGLAWSRRGSRLAFAGFAAICGGHGIRFGLHVVGADGRGYRRLAAYPPGAWRDRRLDVALGPIDWAPDNTHLAYGLTWIYDCTTNAVMSSEVLVINSDGSRRKAIVPQGAPIDDLEWSPDGEVIAYAPRCDYPTCDIVTVDPSGHRRRKLAEITIDGTSTLAADVAWSPRGDALYAVVDNTTAGPTQSFHLYRLGRDSGKAVKLVAFRENHAGASIAAVSRDGRRIAVGGQEGTMRILDESGKTLWRGAAPAAIYLP